MLCLNEVERVVTSSPHIHNGVDCRFYRIGNIGIKVWWNEEIAIKCHLIQAQLHELGIAPEVLSPVFEISEQWAFQTEICVPIAQSHKEEYDKACREALEKDEYLSWWEWSAENIQDEMDMIKEGKKALKELGWVDTDAHANNWAVVNGNPVVIDTGSMYCKESLCDDDECEQCYHYRGWE